MCLPKATKPSGPSEADLRDLHAKIGRLAVEDDFFVSRAQAMKPAEEKSMIVRQHPKLSII
jgi:hypothetical protein